MMRKRKMGGSAVHKIPLEVVGTVLEVADVAWSAIEHRHEAKHHETKEGELRDYNLRLRAALEENHAILNALSSSPQISKDCPPDLYMRIRTAADSPSFLKNLESLHQDSTQKESDNSSVTDQHKVEEDCEIDDESYVIVNEDNVIDGVADFVAKCIFANPKSKMLTPVEVQKGVTKALDGIKDRRMLSKVWTAVTVIYALSTWGIALAGLYRHREMVKVAAKGVGATGKLLMKAL